MKRVVYLYRTITYSRANTVRKPTFVGLFSFKNNGGVALFQIPDYENCANGIGDAVFYCLKNQSTILMSKQTNQPTVAVTAKAQQIINNLTGLETYKQIQVQFRKKKVVVILFLKKKVLSSSSAQSLETALLKLQAKAS